MTNTVKKRIKQKYSTLVINLPKEKETEIRARIAEKFRGNQEVFDVFVISGIVLRNHAVLDAIDRKLPEYIKEKSEEIYKRFQGQKSERQYFKISCTILPNDKQALDNFCVDKGYKKAELFHIIFSDLIFDENEDVLKFVNDIKDRDVIRKKKEITKLHEEEFVDFLDPKTRSNLLSVFTERLDQGKFAPHIVESIHEKMYGMSMKEKEEEDEIDSKLNQKIRAKKFGNTVKIRKIIDDASKYNDD